MRTAILLSALLLAGAALADDAPPPIRDFDIPTVEKLGQQMYAQDQEAWKATDILRAQISADQKPHGWIVVSRPGGDVVRFIRDGANGPEVWCDVAFTSGTGSACNEPQDHALASDELAQYHARMLALENVKRGCAKTYNTVALRDGTNWLVWAMAATQDPNAIVIGGHYRFTISPDGTSLIQSDALSRGCLTIQKADDPQKGKFESFFVGHLVSLQPIETYVFANLSAGFPAYIGTLDGKTWKIDGGRIHEIADDAMDPDGLAARNFEGFNEHCKPILTKPIDGTPKFFIGLDIKIVDQTAQAGPFTIAVEDDGKVVEVTCARLSLVPAPNDYKVLAAGYDLSILDLGKGHDKRMIEFHNEGGKLSYTLRQGPPLTPDLQARIDSRLKVFQAALPSH